MDDRVARKRNLRAMGFVWRRMVVIALGLLLLPIIVVEADTFPFVKGEPSEFQYVSVGDSGCGSTHAPTLADRDLLTPLCDLLPPRALEAVEVKGGSLRVYVSRKVAASMAENRLQAYLTVCQFLDLWRAHSGYQAVTAVFAVVQHSPVYRGHRFYRSKHYGDRLQNANGLKRIGSP